MKLFRCSDYDYRCCHFNIRLYLILYLYSYVTSKCILDKNDVTCFGSTWKQDLLPVDNSLERLYISKCMESQAPSTAVDINFLRNMIKLTHLSMTQCSFIRPPLLDYQINSVQTIDLSDNLIDANAQFPVLGLDFFKQFPNLKVLNLTNNRLTHLPKSWFDCPSQLESIILDGNLIGGLSASLSDCFVKLKHLSLRRNLFERLRKSSNHINQDQSNLVRRPNKKSSYKGEKSYRSRLDYLGIIPTFSSLETLDLSHNKIQSIDRLPLSNLKSLYSLNLSYNFLSTDGNYKENKCYFGTAPFYLNGNAGLHDLDLSGNVGLTKLRNCWTFGLQSLQILRLQNCSVSMIYNSSFDKMKSLTMLDLSHNKLDQIPRELIVVAKTLRWLSLAHNSISQISSSYLNSLKNLRTLNLSHNRYQNLMSFPLTESETGDRDSSSDEPINLLNQMRHLHELDLSFNDLSKVSAVFDLSPSVKSNGELRRVDLRGNPLITQLVDFNANEITTTFTEFLINDDLKLDCDCLIVGFVKWVSQRQLDVSGTCATPKSLSHFSISNPELVTLILNDKSCKDVSSSTPSKTAYKLKLSSNANLSTESSQWDGPMDDGYRKSANQKRHVDSQKWIMAGMNLTLRCEFHYTYSLPMTVVIEWQRLQLKPFDSSHYSKQEGQQNSNPFLKNDKTEQLDDTKYIEKIEHLSSNFDPRIKIKQVGPLDEETIIDHFPILEEWKNTSPRSKKSTFKYVGYLLLKPVFFSDIGRYRCIVNDLPIAKLYGQSHLMSKEENIKVFTPPRFTSTPSNPMSIIEGETAEITCRAVGNPSPKTSLGIVASNDFPAAMSRRLTMYKDDSSFFINNVQPVDAANYTCISRNAAGIIAHNFTLKVQMPSTILNRVQPSQTLRVGDPLIIRFKVKGVPAPAVKWFKDNRRLVHNDRITFSYDQFMLIIQSTVLSDAGVYKMSVLNALGGNDASLTVVILPSRSPVQPGPPALVTDKSPTSNADKDAAWMPDYWLSGIIIVVILSIVITSILWITIFFCFSRVIDSKKRRLLLASTSLSRGSFDKKMNSTTTSFSNARLGTSALLKSLTDCTITPSLTTSTIVPHDLDSANIDTFVDTTKAASNFYSPHLIRSSPSYFSNRFLSQPYLSTSGIDLSNKVSQLSSSSSSRRRHRAMDPCDSGIDSSHVYSETVNSGHLPLTVYQCRHKSKHRAGHQKQRKRYTCSNSNDSSDSAVKQKRTDARNSDNESSTVETGCHESSLHFLGHPMARHCTTPLITDNVGHSS